MGNDDMRAALQYARNLIGPDEIIDAALATKAEPAGAWRSVTRFEVIDHRPNAPDAGRCFVAKPCAVELSVQDDGKTLKVFVFAPQQNIQGGECA